MMAARPWVRRFVVVAVFLVATIAAYVPVLFLLARTPLHDGSDVPTDGLWAGSLVASLGLGALAAGIVRRLFTRGEG
jgi:hypothetical protein